MIEYEKFKLDNGLTVIVHIDKSTPIVAMNILYNVGAKDEEENLTGFAHLFEHLMFGGSKNIPKYDVPLERVGGENNAFTNNDITNYYLSLPKENVETAFWIESDRMLDLAFSKKSLEVQKNVVIEEYKQRYLNQPYGDVWLKIRPMAYKVHPYRWATIGKDISHIEKAQMQDVKDFYKKFYNPNNAIMVIAGDVEIPEIKRLCEKWFAPISSGNIYQRNIKQEPIQTEKRICEVQAKVPSNAIYKVFHIPGRLDTAYYINDLTSDILSNGKSSRLYQNLVQKKQIFTNVQAFISGDFDPGLFVIAGFLNENIAFSEAEKYLWEELESIKTKVIDSEIEKVKTKLESNFVFGEINLLERAMNLASFELLGSAGLYNQEVSKYKNITGTQILQNAQTTFTENNSSTLYYQKI